MAIEEKEQKETILDELIEKVEKDPLPTNIFTTEDTDPLVLLGKLNEVIARLKDLRALYFASDSKATEALTKAIESLTIAQEAITTATTIGNEAKTLAQNALEQANSAHDTAGEALMEATDAKADAQQAITTATTLGNEAKAQAQQAITTATTLGNEAKADAQEAIQKANEALQQVVQGLGTKVYDIAGNLLAGAKFSGHNGINVDMDETDPENFNIRLDNELVGQLEDMQTKIAKNASDITTNTSNISTLSSQIDMVDGLIDTLEARMSSVESTASANAKDLEYVNNKIGEGAFDVSFLYEYQRKWETSGDAHYIGFNGFNPKTRAERENCVKIGIGSDDPALKISSNGSNILWVATNNIKRWIKNDKAQCLELNDGTIIQWGAVFTASRGTFNVPLISPMPSTRYAVLYSQEQSNNFDWNKTCLTRRSTTGFTLRNDAYSMYYSWLAIYSI